MYPCLSLRVHNVGNELIHVVEVARLGNRIVVITMRKLPPDHFLSSAEPEKLFHVRWSAKESTISPDTMELMVILTEQFHLEARRGTRLGYP